MLLSRKFVSDYIDLDDKLSINSIADAMTSVGNEYDYAGKLINATNLVTGEVLECVDRPINSSVYYLHLQVKSINPFPDLSNFFLKQNYIYYCHDRIQ